MLAINCSSAVTRVRRRISDAGANMFSDAEVLEALDDALQPIWTTVRLSGEQREMDQISVALSAMTQVATDILEFNLPEYVGEIRQIEGNPASGNTPVIFPKAYLPEKESGRGFGSGPVPVWFFSKFDRPGRIQIRGRTTGYQTVDIWFARRWPPLHHGTAAAGAAGTITFDATPIGVVFPRDDVYNGIDLEVLADSGGAANVGAIRRITGFVGATKVATMESNWPAVTSSTTVYAMVIPLDPEHVEYLVEETAYELFSRVAEPEHLEMAERRLHRIRERFETSVRTRHNAEPMRLWSGRRSRI